MTDPVSFGGGVNLTPLDPSTFNNLVPQLAPLQLPNTPVLINELQPRPTTAPPPTAPPNDPAPIIEVKPPNNRNLPANRATTATASVQDVINRFNAATAGTEGQFVIAPIVDAAGTLGPGYRFTLLPAMASTLRVNIQGNEVPDARPGITLRTSMSFRRFNPPGAGPVYQGLGIEQTQLQLVGAFVGNEGFGATRPGLAPLYQNSTRLDAYGAARTFDEGVIQNGQPVKIFIKSSSGFDRDQVLEFNRCVINSMRYFATRSDRVYYLLDISVAEYKIQRDAAAARAKAIAAAELAKLREEAAAQAQAREQASGGELPASGQFPSPIGPPVQTQPVTPPPPSNPPQDNNPVPQEKRTYSNITNLITNTTNTNFSDEEIVKDLRPAFLYHSLGVLSSDQSVKDQWFKERDAAFDKFSRKYGVGYTLDDNTYFPDEALQNLKINRVPPP